MKTRSKMSDVDEAASKNHVEVEDSQPDTDLQNEIPQKIKRPPRSERKRRRHEELLLEKKERRKQKKMERKERLRENTDASNDEERLSKRDMCNQIRERLQEGRKSGQRICLDVSMEDFMSEKEKGKLAMQIGRLYGCNRHTASPAHIYLTGMDKNKSLYRHCVQKNSGFDNYLIDIDNRRHTDIFPTREIVYLSPDSEAVLTDVDLQKVYIIGGLVDESIKKNITESQAKSEGIQTARLPIVEYMTKLDQESHSTVLAANQVFEILVTFIATKDWTQALAVGVPRRKGYIPRELEKS